jgi:hypothetical protein
MLLAWCWWCQVRRRLAPIRGIPTKAGGMQDPNSDIREIFDVIESIPTAPVKLVEGFLSWARGEQDPDCGCSNVTCLSGQLQLGACWPPGCRHTVLIACLLSIACRGQEARQQAQGPPSLVSQLSQYIIRASASNAFTASPWNQLQTAAAKAGVDYVGQVAGCRTVSVRLSRTTQQSSVAGNSGPSC